MAICTKCGAVLNEEDVSTHVCNEEDVPVKGKVKRQTQLSEDIA